MKSSRFSPWVWVALLALPLTACHRQAAEDACEHCHPKTAASPAERHPLRGVVKAVNVEGRWADVRHEEIPGFMKAMTMRFQVSPEDAQKLKTGDTLTAKMGRVGDDWVLEEIQITAAAVTP